MSKKLWLGIDENSQLAKVLEVLAKNPVARTSDLASLWEQNAKAGGKTQISGSRAAFLADVIGDAAGGITRPRKGVVAYPSLRESLRTDAPSNSAIQVHESKTVEVVDAAPAMAGKAPIKFQDVTEASEEEFVFPQAPVQPKCLGHFIKPDWYDEFVAALEDGYHISLAGPPGVGKSTVPEQVAVIKGQTVVTINAHGGLKYRDVAGHIQVVGGRTRFLVAEYAAAAINGWWVILNEVNAADEAAILFMNGQLAPPYTINLNGKTFPVHKNFRVIVNYNPGYVGTKPLNAALKDRFESFKVPFPDKEILREMLFAHGMKRTEPTQNRLLAYAYECVSLKKRGVMRYEVSPRRLYSIIRHLNRGQDLATAIEYGLLNSVDSESDLTQLKKALETVGIVKNEQVRAAV